MSLYNRAKAKASALGASAKSFGKKTYKMTSARKTALMKAVKASAMKRKRQGGMAISKTKIKVNRAVNKATGSKTSALRKRQTAKQSIRKAKSTVKKKSGTAKRNISRILGRDGKNGPATRSKVRGLPTKSLKNGPATRAKSSSTGRAITAESKKLQARGAKPATAKRTAQQKLKLQKKKKK
jgi:hypothetical protein